MFAFTVSWLICGCVCLVW